MRICLVVQKDTLEKDKVKSVLKAVDKKPEDFVTSLQEGHCIPYQLVAHTENDPILLDRLISTVSSHKTSYGKDWYELDSETLSKVLSLFIESKTTVIHFPTISSVFGFSFSVFPVITKEITITGKQVEIKDIKHRSSRSERSEKAERSEKSDKHSDKSERSEKSEKHSDKSERSEKSEKHSDKNEKHSDKESLVSLIENLEEPRKRKDKKK